MALKKPCVFFSVLQPFMKVMLFINTLRQGYTFMSNFVLLSRINGIKVPSRVLPKN